MIKPQILLINKDLSSRTMLKYIIETNHYKVFEAKDILSGINTINTQMIHLTIIDADMVIENPAIIQTLASNQQTVARPVVLLMPEMKMPSKFSALKNMPHISAIINRPFSPSELIQSIKTLLKTNNKPENNELISVAGITINPKTKQVTINNQPIKIGHIEYDLLSFFVTNTDKIFSRKNILDHVWGKEKTVDERTVDVHIRKLRKILSPYHYDLSLQTVHGAGYRFISEKLEVV